MNIFFIIQPRQSGKTTVAISEYLLDYDNTVFVSPNSQSARDVERLLRIPRNTVLIPENFGLRMINRHPNNVIMDEYLCYRNHGKLYNQIRRVNSQNLYIFTSSYKQYERRMVGYIREKKLNGETYMEIWHDNRNGNHLKEIEELYYNHITDPGIILIDNAFQHTPEFIEGMRPMYEGRFELFNTEILNNYLKN